MYLLNQDFREPQCARGGTISKASSPLITLEYGYKSCVVAQVPCHRGLQLKGGLSVEALTARVGGNPRRGRVFPVMSSRYAR
jgi:hypothetical protein